VNEQLDNVEAIINELSPKLNAYLKYLDMTIKKQHK